MNTPDITKLPFLISRQVFLQVSGIPERTFEAMVAGGEIRRLVPNRGPRRLRKGLYYRVDLERIALGPPSPQTAHR